MILLLCLFTVQQVEAQNIKKVAQTGLQFLKVDMSPRSAAMGGANSMVAYDASALFSNPAGMALMTSQADAFVSQISWIADISYNAGGAAFTAGNIGTFGINFISADYGEIQGTRVESSERGYELTQKLDVGAYAVGLGYARKLTNKFSVGGHINYVGQHLGQSVLEEGEDPKENRVSGLAYDFGTIFYPGLQSVRFGMSIRNFSPEFKYETETFQLPLTFRIGLAVDVLDFLGGMENHSLLLNVDALHPRDYTERIHIGSEYMFSNLLALRAGYKTNYDEEGLSLGFGVNYEISGIGLRVDYAYSAFGVFNSVSRIGIGASF